MNYKNVVVFGGSGFLGGYVVNELENRGYNVIVADLKKSDHHKSAEFVSCNIENYDEVLNAIPENIDVIYNFAGFANLERAIKNPRATIELNIIGNLNILEACRIRKPAKFVYASSAYAMSNKGSFYGISKLASEKLIEEYNIKYGLQFIILRYGSVYSEREFDNNYIYNLVKEAILHKKIEHNGDGDEIREYIHAADVSTLSVDVIESDSFNNLHVILTGTERMKRIELFNMINEILNNSIQINCNDSGYQNHYKYTPYSFVPSVSKKLIANPHIDMGQGILECIRSVYENEI